MVVDRNEPHTNRAEAWREDVDRTIADLDRLVGLIGDAGATLVARFDAARHQAAEARLPALEAELDAAITALQFPDIAHQLIAHARAQLGQLSDRLAGVDADVRVPSRRCGPVSQTAMHAGSIELF